MEGQGSAEPWDQAAYDRRVAEWEAAERATYAAVTDARLLAALDILAPVRDWGGRSPVFEWGHETTPRAAEMIELAEEIVAALDAVTERSPTER